MLKTTLTFKEKRMLTEFMSSQPGTHMEEVDTTLTGYFDHKQIQTALEQYGASVLQVEDGNPASDRSGPQEIEPLL